MLEGCWSDMGTSTLTVDGMQLKNVNSLKALMLAGFGRALRFIWSEAKLAWRIPRLSLIPPNQ
jgi:hypothetical protein